MSTRPEGTDGTDYKFRQRIVAPYQMAANARKGLKTTFVVHVVYSAALAAIKVLADGSVNAFPAVPVAYAQFDLAIYGVLAVASLFEIVGFGKLDSPLLVRLYILLTLVALLASGTLGLGPLVLKGGEIYGWSLAHIGAVAAHVVGCVAHVMGVFHAVTILSTSGVSKKSS
jgi:hypothetical protein